MYFDCIVQSLQETLFTILYNDLASIRRHQMTVDINYGHLTPTHQLQCQIDRVSCIEEKKSRSMTCRVLGTRIGGINRTLSGIYRSEKKERNSTNDTTV